MKKIVTFLLYFFLVIPGVIAASQDFNEKERMLIITLTEHEDKEWED